MTVILAVRGISAVLFLAAFFGMSKDWQRRSANLTLVGRRQYQTYYLGILIAMTASLVGLFSRAEGSWLDWARLVWALVAAWSSNWRLHEEYRGPNQ